MLVDILNRHTHRRIKQRSHKMLLQIKQASLSEFSFHLKNSARISHALHKYANSFGAHFQGPH